MTASPSLRDLRVEPVNREVVEENSHLASTSSLQAVSRNSEMKRKSKFISLSVHVCLCVSMWEPASVIRRNVSLLCYAIYVIYSVLHHIAIKPFAMDVPA